MVVFVVITVPTAAAATAAATAAVTAAIAATTAATSVVDTAAAAVATTAMDGGTLCVCGVQLGDLHTHTKNHRHSGDRWKDLLKAESFSTFN